ncbi:hypothetical protein GCM10008932_20450 [Alkalibacterium iburiense]|uniref:DUF3221 domain-containing protein n=1 Tax=Alkalibacterium iburiense TaxID=290589 RepID=A0ABN0XNB0_9LACT
MKKAVMGLVVLVALLLSGCEEAVFEGTVAVVEAEESILIVEPHEGESIRQSGTLVSLSVPEDHTYEVGDTVRVTHEGPVMESHPLQVNLISIKKTSGGSK